MATRHLIVRVTNFDGTNPITLQNADSIQVFETVNSSDEGVSFIVPSNDAKIANIDYTKWWEVWDSLTNERINWGPIFGIEDANDKWTITGPGKSQILQDQISTKHTFYYPINRFLDDLRYENVANEPRTTVWVYGYSHQPPTKNLKYYGLSKRTGPNILDEKAPFTVQDQRLPAFHTTDSYWSGTDKADGISINLGQSVDIAKVQLIFPWWGGYKRFTDRSYDFSLQHSTTSDTYTTDVTKTNNQIITNDVFGGFNFYFRSSGDNPLGFEPLIEQIQDTPINAQYWRVDISDTHAWYSHGIGGAALTDNWQDQCTPPPVTVSSSGVLDPVYNVQASGSISTYNLLPQNDCHASLVQFGAYQEILGMDYISNLVYQQVDNTSNQVTYVHTPGGEEVGVQLTTSTQAATPIEATEGAIDGKDYSHTLTKYDPGNFLHRVRFTWTGAGQPFTEFFPDDPPKSMTSSVVAVVDQNNSLVYRTLLTSGTKDLILPAYTEYILIKGATGVTINQTDAWLGEDNAFSIGNSVSVSVTQGDTAVLHFKGSTLKLFVTIPTGKQPGSVQLDLRTQQSDGTFGGWTTLVDNLQLPANVANYKVYEIVMEDNILDPTGNTIYEFRVTNRGGYVGLDAFAGYWQASWQEFNEDHERIYYNDNANAWVQIYDERFSGGTMNKTREFGAHMQFGFEGDRIQLFMAKGPNFGKATIYFSGHGAYSTIVPIPSIGDSFIRDLGKEDTNDPTVDGTTDITHYIPRYLAFDSNWFWPNGMPWDQYNFHVRLLETETYTAYVNQSTEDSFDQTCIDCANGQKMTQNKAIYIDGVSAHCTTGLSAKFINETNLDILKSTATAIQNEWRVTNKGLRIVPRIGQDTNVIIKEGEKAYMTHDATNDVSNVATLLYSNGADIDGLPLFTITEDKQNKIIMGRTIARINDFRDISDYFTLIGASRAELFKRRTPDIRLDLNWAADTLPTNPDTQAPIDLGDSFIWVTENNKDGKRVRLTKITQNQDSANGLNYQLECEKWPQQE